MTERVKMLLMKLKTPEKFSFIYLAHFISRIDGTFSDKEENILEEFCLEMGIENILFDESFFDLEKTLSDFKSQQSKKIVLLNLMLLIHIDDNFDIYEHQLADTISERFGLTARDVLILSQWGKIASANYMQALALVE